VGDSDSASGGAAAAAGTSAAATASAATAAAAAAADELRGRREGDWHPARCVAAAAVAASAAGGGPATARADGGCGRRDRRGRAAADFFHPASTIYECLPLCEPRSLTTILCWFGITLFFRKCAFNFERQQACCADSPAFSCHAVRPENRPLSPGLHIAALLRPGLAWLCRLHCLRITPPHPTAPARLCDRPVPFSRAASA